MINVNISEGIRVKTKQITPYLSNYQYKNYRKDTIVTPVFFDKETNEWVLPRNLKKFKSFCKNFNIKKDLRVKDKDLESSFKLKSHYKPYDWQEEIINQILQYLEMDEGACILKAPPRTGKTYMLPYIVSKLKKKTLILVDRTNLVEQMYSEFIANSEGDIQIVTAKTDRVADVNISTLQLLNRNKNLIKMFKNQISFVVVDEAHLVSVGALTNVILQFPAYYRLALTATPSRSDGLTPVIFDHFSYNIVESSNPNNLSTYHLIVYYPLQVWYEGIYDANKAWKIIYTNINFVNDIIALAIKMKEKGRATFIYSTFQDQQELITELLKSKGFSVEIINAKTKAKKRREVLEAFKENKLDFLVSGVILQKGISLHRMDTIINVSNHTKESFEQMVGRIRGLHNEKKDPIIFHFCFGGKGAYKCHNIKAWTSKLSKKNNDKVVRWTYEKFKGFLTE